MNRSKILDIILLVLLSALWGGSYTLIHVGVTTIPPLTLIAARTVLAAGVLFAFIRAARVAIPRDLATWRDFAVQALFNSVVPFTLIAWAQREVDASLATILNSLSPVFTWVLTLGGSSPLAERLQKGLGVGCGLAGVALIVGVGIAGGEGHTAQELAIVFGSLCYAFAAMYGKRFAGLDSRLPAAGSLACGAVLLVPLSLLVDTPWRISPSAESAAALVALAVVSTALAQVLYFRLVRNLGSLGVTAQAYLRVPFGVAIGVAFLGERLAPSAWLGFILVVSGVAAMALPVRARQR